MDMPDKVFDFPTIEPDAMPVGADIEQKIVFTNTRFLHFRPADGTFAMGLFRDGIGRSKRIRNKPGMVIDFHTRKKQVKFTGIEPDAVAGSAVIKFDLVVLDDYHILRINRANHVFKPLLTLIPSLIGARGRVN
jgi:hypothetical protein